MTREHFFGGQTVHYCQLLAYRRIIRPWVMADSHSDHAYFWRTRTHGLIWISEGFLVCKIHHRRHLFALDRGILIEADGLAPKPAILAHLFH
jgi:hypothetical protein